MPFELMQGATTSGGLQQKGKKMEEKSQGGDMGVLAKVCPKTTSLAYSVVISSVTVESHELGMQVLKPSSYILTGCIPTAYTKAEFMLMPRYLKKKQKKEKCSDQYPSSFQLPCHYIN